MSGKSLVISQNSRKATKGKRDVFELRIKERNEKKSFIPLRLRLFAPLRETF